MFLFSITAWIYSNSVVVLVSFITYFVVKQIYQEYESKKKLPPGPRGLPFIGSLPYLRKEPSRTLAQWSKRYGNVFGIQLGTIPALVLNDWPSIKEAFSKDSFSGRPEDNAFNSIIPLKSFANSSGSLWKEQRRFALHQLRNLGFGKNSMEDHILDEISHLTEQIDKSDGLELEIRKYLSPSVSNNINSLVFGHRLDYEDENRKMLDEILIPDPNLTLIGILAFFPALMRFVSTYLFFLLPSSMKERRGLLLILIQFIRNQMDSHDKTLNQENIRDYIDSFLNEMKQHKNEEKTSFTRKMLEGNIFALFGAGSGTVLTTLVWSTLILATHPDIQKKLQQEIDTIIGKERRPQFSDRIQMPYMYAFMWEVWRFRTVTPINLPRKTMEETTIQGYKIPKDTQVLANFWALNNDPDLWDKPHEFNLERHLSEDKKQFIRHDYLIPFSYGKRSCPGESLGIQETFLYLSSLLQKYDLKPSPNTDLKLEFEFQFSVVPKHKPVMCFTKRI